MVGQGDRLVTVQVDVDQAVRSLAQQDAYVSWITESFPELVRSPPF